MPGNQGVWLKRCCLVTVLSVATFCPLLGSARACPFCDGGPSGVNPVKEQVFGPDFWPNLLATALPFAVFLGTAAIIHFGLPPWKRPAGLEEGGANGPGQKS